MTISELICRLQAIKCEHGDLIVHVGIDYRDVRKVVTNVFIQETNTRTKSVALSAKS